MTNITIRQLRYFESLVRHGHFGRAAEACAVSQPALSVQIKELEENLGGPLFERLPRKVLLTTLGRHLETRARDILKSVDDLGDLARAGQETLAGQLRLGVIPTIAPYLLPQVIHGLTQTLPAVDVHIRETMTPTLIQELTGGGIDAAIVALPISEPSLIEAPLFDEAFVLVRPIADGNKPLPNRQSLREMKLLLLEEGHCFRDQALSFCAIQPGTARETLDATSLATLVQMVGSGVGVTLIPEIAIGVETRSAQVAITPFTAPQPSRTIGLIWRRSSPLTKQFEQIAQIVKQAGETVLSAQRILPVH
ncbi:LysR substrate-binding domain-containing protein [Pelagimonas varians]|uniref:Hydrogen peroxide-inducible genes activator n=1 Tax=Pelagimonas varians TaxID=696760 RepID=A0A238L175_9RHOB|nr:LysR substrate-binding domain-containing protein [Pelagimonas varians]PYG27185.1 LysR family hydrogen peroxide-inducible transcriptional activator [Pelagimonas varians]SMX48769.1 Hydrogen peroxide-inducible genes activator [Pelagimonas varians]